MTQSQKPGKGDKMITSMKFGDDDDDVQITNTCLGKPSDQCAADLDLLHDAMTGGGGVLTEDMEIAPPASGQMNTTGQKAIAKNSGVKIGTQTSQKVQAKTG